MRTSLIAATIALASAAGCSSQNEAAVDAGSRDDAAIPSGDAATVDVGPGSSDGDAEASPPPTDGSVHIGFWDTGDIPAAKNVMMFRFLNRTNGKLKDSEVYWSFHSGTISELHSIADMPTYDMPANASGRMYFYLCPASDPASCAGGPSKSKYFDFIEHTIGPAQYNGNTTRVDAFGLKLALRLHCRDGYDTAVGEDYETFLEDRAVTFQKFLDEVPTEFRKLAEPPYAPYRIVEPGAVDFTVGGANEHYYDPFVDRLWAANGLTIAKPGADGSGLAAYPDVSAAIFRHVGDAAGSFTPDGKLLNKSLWTDATTFYSAAPANYYAKFWHTHALSGRAYGFPYDDVGSYSSYVSHKDPQYMLVAIGW